MPDPYKRPFDRPRPQLRPAPRPREAPPGSEDWPKPWVQIKYFSFQPNIYPNMIATASDDAKVGDVVTVYDKEGRPFGHGMFNPKGRVPLRLFNHGSEPLAEDHFPKLIRQAVELRLSMLRLSESTDAFRVIHADGDTLPGVMVDKYGDVLSIETTNAAAHRLVGQWVPLLHELLGTERAVIRMDDAAFRAESLLPEQVDPYTEFNSKVSEVKITENGIRFSVNFASGHKTGFFCDQRDNRAKFGRLANGRRVLDLCCYTGGFSVAAKMLGGCEDVTAVDLDEKAIEQAKRNANLNQARISFIHADAFTWMRQMQKNGETWGAVVLDPPKLIFSREGFDEGRAKYHDMNKLALSLVEPGGLFLTCSCSGLMPVAEFEDIVIGVAHRSGRKLQILDWSGAGADHPVMSNCPESRYLKALWARVW